MFSDNQRTSPGVAWAIVLICLVSFTPVAMDLFLFSKQRVQRLHVAEADAASARAPVKLPSKVPAPETMVKNLVLAWNRGDPETIARMFLPDGVLITPTGSVIRSRSSIRKRLLDERSGRLKDSTLTNTVDDVTLVDANTALVKGKYVLDGMTVMGIKTSPTGSYVLRQKNLKGAWMIEKAEVLGKK
ncbi:MAG TPA: SgcJ/EcaC family oxidoreductase [Candidatus Binatia bacterium]|nr:SgcJ/EcaC family oxidoreductase [Candidatus Binatia bacterium]